jgi:hypothetical protein
MANADVQSSVAKAADQIVKPSWLSQKALKFGLVTSFCATQYFSGLVEGYHFRGGIWIDTPNIPIYSENPTYIINGSNYHAYETFRDIGYITSGYLTYANIRNPHESGWGKARRITGTLLLGRDFKEMAYRTARYNNPFDYNASRNEHSIVYFGVRNGKLCDLYIGTGKYSGPTVDIVFAAAGLLLLSWE